MSSFNIKNDVTWRDFLIRSAFIIGTVVIIVWMMPRSSNISFKIERGKPWTYSDLKAPFDFPIYKSDEVVKAERDSLMQQYEPYYLFNDDVVTKQIRQFVKDYNNGIPGLSKDYISIVANRLRSLYAQGIMNSSEYDRLNKDTTRNIRVINGKDAISTAITKVHSVVSAYEQIFLDESLAAHREILQKCNLNDYLTPNLIYDKERSEASLNDLRNSIPLASGLVQRGQKIIDRGDIVDAKTYDILISFEKETQRRETGKQQISLTIMGQIMYVGILITCFTVFLTLFRKDYFEKMRSTTMLYALITIFAVFASLMVKHNILHVYIIPFAMVPIFIRVFMDSRTAFMAHVTMILICASFLQYPLEFITVELVAGLVAIFSLRELSSRSQLFWTAVFVTLGAAVTNLALDWIRNDDILKISYSEYNYLAINGLLLFCSYPLLYLIEKAFGFTSNITLIELSDMNKTLLRKMSEVAPGTFQHSIQVGNLAAEIANKIGGKSQLVRTGAMYHDIGKMLNPTCFIENDSLSGNGPHYHDGLTPKESAIAIIKHVSDGLELAKEHNLPDLVTAFIKTHHGTSNTGYFYAKYLNEGGDPKDVDCFFYKGAKPRSKEQVILMLCDSVEAASRTLKDNSPETFSEFVENIVESKIIMGQLDDAELSIRQLNTVKDVLKSYLAQIYHERIAYPPGKNE